MRFLIACVERSAPVLLAIVLGGILIAASGRNPAAAYGAMLSGAFGSSFDFAATLASSLPLMFTGLAVALGFQAGLFNIGASGQFWMGAIAAAWAGFALSLPGWLHVPVALVSAMAAGALWAAVVPGLAKAYRGANEVVTTLMTTYIAVEFGRFLLEDGPMRAPGFSPESPVIAETAKISPMIAGTQLSWGLFIAPAVCCLAWLLLNRTSLGFGLRMTGLNSKTAKYAGVDSRAAIVAAFALSGAVAGLAGGVQILGQDYRLYDSFDLSCGFTGIVVALLARNHPLGVIPAALLFGALDNGANAMQIFAEIPANLADVLKGLIVFFAAIEGLTTLFSKRKKQACKQAGAEA